MTIRAKICGLVRAADAAHAVRHGADYLGVIFAGGPRLLAPAAAREIVSAADKTPVFGVFGETDAAAILRTRDRSGIRGVQLHGGGDAPLIATLLREELTVWAVRRLAIEADLATLEDGAALAADAVLVEPHVAGMLGGTGQALGASLAQAARARLAGRSMVLAGGLTPENAGERLALVGPDVADVSSGVEAAPGEKDPERVIRFLEVVRGSAARA